MLRATKDEIENWMRNQIIARKLMEETLLLEEGEPLRERLVLSNLSSTRAIHVGGESVRAIAERTGLDLCVKSRQDRDNPYHVFVIFEGEEFFGIETEEEYTERGRVV